MNPLTNEQINFVIHSVAEWIEIRNKNIKGHTSSADATHSALLLRLLSGLKPLDKPPPKAYSYPWYDLAEGKPCIVWEAYPYKYSEENENRWVIEQCRDWIRLEDGRMLHDPTRDIYKWISTSDPELLKGYGILQKDT